jgi:hypothetical protein
MPSSIGSGRSTLQGELGDRFLSGFCVHGPFVAWGVHGEEEYP